MPAFEYKVVPSPARGEKAKGVKGAQARFAHAVETLMNQMAAEGWEYQRTETLPSEERSGLASTTTVWRTLMIFRRAPEDALAEFAPRRPVAAPAPDAPGTRGAAPSAPQGHDP
ncbi:DUF4177 domain-containing protein, partial [Roseivivax sp. CAU 1761]